jgi:hypothetical protein
VLTKKKFGLILGGCAMEGPKRADRIKRDVSWSLVKKKKLDLLLGTGKIKKFVDLRFVDL